MFIFEKQHQPINISDASCAGQYQTDKIFPYVIKTQEGNQTIGYLFPVRTDETELHINFIEIVDELKEQGWGTKVVRAIFSAFNVTSIEGMTLIDDGGRAYYFWSSLGAEMSVDADSYEWGSFDDEIYFSLKMPVEEYLPGVICDEAIQSVI